MDVGTKRIIMKDKIAQNLSLRTYADWLFDEIDNSDDSKVILDFEGINSMSRSFAQQLTQRMENSNKPIELVNKNNDIEMLLKIVKSPKKKAMLV